MRSIVRRIVFGVGLLFTAVGAVLVGYSLFGTGAILTEQSRRIVQVRGNDYPIAEVFFVRCEPLRLIFAFEEITTHRFINDSKERTSVDQALSLANVLTRWKLKYRERSGFAESQIESPPSIRLSTTTNWRVGPFAYGANQSGGISEWAFSFPTWPIPLIGLAILATTGPLSVGAFRRRSRVRRGACVACGYDRRSLAVDAACPECGKVGCGSGATTRL